jgi:hypothetical protein
MFGRRPILLGGLLFFAVGSAMCEAAVSRKVELTTEYYRRWLWCYF